MKRFVGLTIVFALLLGLFGCQNTDDTNNFPVTINETEIASAPNSVAVLSGSIYSVCEYFGYDNKIVAVAENIDSEMTKISVEPFLDCDLLVSIGAKFVLTQSALSSTDAQTLKDNNVTVVTLPLVTKLEDIKQLYTDVAKFFKGETDGLLQAEKQFALLTDNFGQINEQTTKSAVFVGDTSLLFCNNNIVSDVLEKSGYENLLSNCETSVLSFDSLKNYDPDIIFCNTGLKNSIMDNSLFSSLSAVENGSVYEINVSDITSFTNSVATTAIVMHNYGYPQNFISYIASAEVVK